MDNKSLEVQERIAGELQPVFEGAKYAHRNATTLGGLVEYFLCIESHCPECRVQNGAHIYGCFINSHVYFQWAAMRDRISRGTWIWN